MTLEDILKWSLLTVLMSGFIGICVIGLAVIIKGVIHILKEIFYD